MNGDDALEADLDDGDDLDVTTVDWGADHLVGSDRLTWPGCESAGSP